MPSVADLLSGPVRPAAVGGPLPAKFAGPVRLFGDVGQMEVGGKGPGELCRRVQVHLGQLGAPRGTVGAHEASYLLDKIEKVRPLLADQGLAEQHADAWRMSA